MDKSKSDFYSRVLFKKYKTPAKLLPLVIQNSFLTFLEVIYA